MCVVHTAGRVVGGVQNDGFGVRRDKCAQPGGIQLEAVRRGVVRDEGSAAQADNLFIQNERGRRDDDLVSWVQNAEQGDKQRFRRADGHNDLVRRIVHSVLLALKAGNSFAQGVSAVIIDIVGLPGIQRLRHGVANGLRRGKIRLAERQRDAAGRFFCKLGKFPDSTSICAVDGFIQLHYNIPFACVNVSSTSSVAR